VVSYNTVVSAHLHSLHSWRRGVVVSGVPRVNEVNPRRARLVFGWATVFRRVHHLGMQPANQVNSALHPSGVAKRLVRPEPASSTSFGWGTGGNVTSAEWQVTLRDPVWHTSSRSDGASCKLLYAVYPYLHLTFHAEHWFTNRVETEKNSRTLPIALPFPLITALRYETYPRADLR